MAAVATSQQPMSVLSRVERLDLMMSYLEEMKGSRYNSYNKCASATASSGTATTAAPSDGGNSSVNSSPKKRCRPIDDVVMETQVKGNLIERVDQLEGRLLKLEEDVDNQKKRQVEDTSPQHCDNSKKHNKGLRSLVKSCMRGSLKTKN